PPFATKTKLKSRTAKLLATKSPSKSSATATAEKSPPNTEAKSPATPSKAKSNPTGPATGKPSTGKAHAGNNIPVNLGETKGKSVLVSPCPRAIHVRAQSAPAGAVTHCPHPRTHHSFSVHITHNSTA